MVISTLDFKIRHRKEVRSEDHISQHESFSSDFLVNGLSLLDICGENSGGGRNDFLGCFARGWDRLNSISKCDLLGKSTVEQQSGRALIYLCPECGDIGCGAYAVMVSKTDEHYIWQNFAYENGYEEPIPILIGPFKFEASAYKEVISRATSI